MEILLIGAGAMGSLLGSYLSKNHNLAIYDIDTSKSERLALKVGGKSLAELGELENYDAALVCTPISKTSRIVSSLSGGMSSGSIIMEISSLKSPVMDSLKEASRKGIKAISLHPLFGPGLRDLKKGRAALIRVKDLREEASLTSKIFPFHLIPVETEEHDRAMAWLALIHLIFHAFLKSSDVDSDLIYKLLTTTSDRFLELAISSLTQSSELTEELISLNPYFPEIFGKFTKALLRKDISEMSESKWVKIRDPYEAYISLYSD